MEGWGSLGSGNEHGSAALEALAVCSCLWPFSCLVRDMGLPGYRSQERDLSLLLLPWPGQPSLGD
jgi:hypothetical protein